MGGFMSLSCFKNGSLARDRVRRELGVDWEFFDNTAWEKANNSTVQPSTSNLQPAPLAFPYFEAEITPKHNATGIEANFDWASAAPEVQLQIGGTVVSSFWIGAVLTVLLAGIYSSIGGLSAVVGIVIVCYVYFWNWLG